MASVRYIILSLIYIIDYYFIIYKKEEDSHAIYHNPIFVFFTSTFIFMFIIKYNENNKCTKNKLSIRYLISQSIVYSIVAILSHNLFSLFLEKECMKDINNIIINISNTTYILEALFIAGIVLYTNHLSYFLIYPKCE
jgi:uncharacterized membrane protein YqhA